VDEALVFGEGVQLFEQKLIFVNGRGAKAAGFGVPHKRIGCILSCLSRFVSGRFQREHFLLAEFPISGMKRTERPFRIHNHVNPNGARASAIVSVAMTARFGMPSVRFNHEGILQCRIGKGKIGRDCRYIR
jgi:hypothetical protein